MTAAVKNVEILTTLEEDPHVTFFPWEIDVQDVAAGLAKSIHPLGLLSAVLTDEQWAAYPGNAVPDQAGQIQLSLRYVPPVYVDINDRMTSVELYVAKATNEKLQLWIDSVECLKRALLKSLGRVVRQVIKPKKVRFQMLTVAEIMALVRKRYGRMEKDTKANLQERMLTLLPTADGIDTHVSNLQDMFDVSDTAGFPVDDNRQVEIFRETVCSHPLIVKVLEKFDFDFPDAKKVTYDQITAYLVLHLPNVKHAQLIATRATANLVATTAYSALEAESQRLRAEVERLKRKNPGQQKNGKQNGKQQQGKQSKLQKTNDRKKNDDKRENTKARTGDEPTSNMKYCHGHGYQHSHISAECKMLAGDKQKYNAATRKSKGPNHPPGGSTKVNGQQPKSVVANMASRVGKAYDIDDDNESDQDNEDSAFDETAVFLADVLRDQQSPDDDYSTEEATALMMEDEVLLLDDTTGPRTRTPTIPTNEVPRLPLGVNLEAPRHVGTVIVSTAPDPDPTSLAALPVCPTVSPPANVQSGNSRQSSPHGSPPNEDNSLLTGPTDGYQFRRPFWEAECQQLQNALRKQIAQKPIVESKRVPTADDLQVEFITWLSGKISLPLLVLPTSAGFYPSVYGTNKALHNTTTTPYEFTRNLGAMEGSNETPYEPPSHLGTMEGSRSSTNTNPVHNTGFFDDEYVAGKRSSPKVGNQYHEALNPAGRASPSYSEVRAAALTTIKEIEHHEQRIYQEGYNPAAIRSHINHMLLTSNPAHHLVDFQEKDIPPPNLDAYTHRVLKDLLQQRNLMDQDFSLPPDSVSADGSPIANPGIYEKEYHQRDKKYNRLNRSMYHVYAASVHLIHDRNFLSYCRPSLRNLPVNTAAKLAALKESLTTAPKDAPPYQTILRPATTHTQPVFNAPRPSFADVLTRPLHPRAGWMKDTPPYMTDKEADQVWRQSNDALFGLQSPTNVELEQQIDNLQRLLQRRQSAPDPIIPEDKRASQEMATWRQPIANAMTSRIFRQGMKSGISDKNETSSINQSNTHNEEFFSKVAVPQTDTQVLLQKRPTKDQSQTSSKTNFLSQDNDNDLREQRTGHKWADSPRRQFGDHPRARWRPPSGPPVHALAPYDQTTLNTKEKWAKAHEDNAKRADKGHLDEDKTAPPKKRKPPNDFGGGTFWNRPSASKRKPNHDGDVLMAHGASPQPHDLIVDTGASHVLFQERHMSLLTNVQISSPNKKPYAILRAANGQVLTAIGKGIFRIKHVAVVAYIFRNEDLVHNLLGIAPFADCGCKAVFTATDFTLSHRKTLLVTGKRFSANLWHISLHKPDGPASAPLKASHIPDAVLLTREEELMFEKYAKATDKFERAMVLQPEDDRPVKIRVAKPTQPKQRARLLHEDTRRHAKFVQFVHACCGNPPPTTFLHAVTKGFLSGENQFPRLTSKMVRRHMPNSEATAKGHLSKTRTAQPHALSQAVSARHKHHLQNQSRLKGLEPDSPKLPDFDPTTIPRSRTLHVDYTGRLPQRGSAGTLYFLVACWGSYIHFEPLTTMRGIETAAAVKAAVLFFRKQHIELDTIRMDNQSSPEVRAVAIELELKWELVNPYQKEPNRAERAIKTGKNHMIAVRAGFHRDSPTTFLDRCLFQIELTLNVIHPFEYDPNVSAHHGLFRERFDFARHPIAPVGARVLTWDSPDTRGSWADHGVPGIYLGPAMRHFRGFDIWVPQTSATRVSGTVWWFLAPCVPDDDLLLPDNDHLLYPGHNQRLSPLNDGSDLLGRCFQDPKAGMCCVTRLGPIMEHEQHEFVPTLHYRCLQTRSEFIATVTQIANWIQDGPIIPRPIRTPTRPSAAPVTYPTYFPVNHNDDPNAHTFPALPPAAESDVPTTIPSPHTHTQGPTVGLDTSQELRRSQRKRKAPDFLRPKFKGKVYTMLQSGRLPRKQRVPDEWVYPGKQRVSQPQQKIRRILQAKDQTTAPQQNYHGIFWRYREHQREQRNQRTGWLTVYNRKAQTPTIAMTAITQPGFYERNMPQSMLPPIFPKGPLNLNTDGSPITYRKSHQGPHAAHWAQADAEEMERLFKSGTLRPILLSDIPEGQRATYINPVCSEKTKDNGSLKLRTRATIGGDRISYPYSTTAVTAELESIKILINAMISDNAAFSTVDLEDFYLGTPLPHPEYVRIPVQLIPKAVVEFYLLQPYLHKGALFCVVLKTHYGLPQAGALSQTRLFKHLESHGYYQLFHAPSLFRNKDGTLRFALVVDDFAVVWSSKTAMDHFLSTLRKLYTVKVDYNGYKYLGMSLAIDRTARHVTLTMPGYIAKLLTRVRPNGVKGAHTPSIYIQPIYGKAVTQKATVDVSPLASPAQQHELQVVLGTLLYYARTVDPSVLTVVHELGSVQSRPTLNDIKKMERLLQYVSSHQYHGIRFHASSMQLQIQSDASYLSRPHAKSVLGGLHYLGSSDLINGPIFCTSKLISCVVTSAAEAELGAAFQNGQKGAQFRNTLVELGYPQQPTTIFVDNTVAEGLATDTVNAKRSKSMDVRFFWLRDRVRKLQFRMRHLSGRWNISDFFTKPLPRDKFEQFLPYIVVEVDTNHESPKRQTVVLNKML